MLRAVTGNAKPGVEYRNITGGDAVYSFGVYMSPDDLPAISKQLIDFYRCQDYKDNFLWVDNIRRLKDKEKIEELDGVIITELKKKNYKDIIITIPEIISWDKIAGFSFTRTKNDIHPTVESKKYIDGIDMSKISVKSLKNDRLFILLVRRRQ